MGLIVSGFAAYLDRLTGEDLVIRALIAAKCDYQCPTETGYSFRGRQLAPTLRIVQFVSRKRMWFVILEAAIPLFLQEDLY